MERGWRGRSLSRIVNILVETKNERTKDSLYVFHILDWINSTASLSPKGLIYLFIHFAAVYSKKLFAWVIQILPSHCIARNLWVVNHFISLAANSVQRGPGREQSKATRPYGSVSKISSPDANNLVRSSYLEKLVVHSSRNTCWMSTF